MTSIDLSKLRLDKSGGPSRTGRKPRARIIAAVVAVLAVILVLVAVNPAIEVETAAVAKVYPSQAFTLLNASGYVVAQRKAAVASKATGRLEWLGVEEGSTVRSGQVLARLENRDVVAAADQAAANLNSAKADLADAQQNYDRMQDLRAKGFIAQADFDAADTRLKRSKAALTAAEAALRAAQVNVEYTLIRAPFDAVVLTKDADVGDIVTPLGAAANAKAAVVTIADLGSLLVEADVSESNLQKVRMGEPCEIQLDALPDTRFRGTVHMIVPTADRSKATVLVKVRFIDNDSRILPEMSAKVAFLQREVRRDEKNPITAVNPEAVVTRKGKSAVFLIKGERVTETPVTLGKKMGDMVEVVSGVKAGDKLALKPLDKLKDGTRIKTAEK